jgi:nucleoside-diphosphate-sugar epimerase
MADPVDTLAINTATTIELARLLQENGRFLFCSTSEIYSGLYGLLTENATGDTTPTHPRACYIEAKRCGEAICNAFDGTHGRTFRSARISLGYGPGTRKDDQRVINDFIRAALINGKIEMRDSGHAYRTYCYVSDVVEMLFNVLLHGKEPVYNVGGIYGVTIRELAESICKLTGASLVVPETPDTDLSAPSVVKMALDRYTKEFGKNAASFVSLNEGLKSTIDWQRELYKVTSAEMQLA